MLYIGIPYKLVFKRYQEHLQKRVYLFFEQSFMQHFVKLDYHSLMVFSIEKNIQDFINSNGKIIAIKFHFVAFLMKAKWMKILVSFHH